MAADEATPAGWPPRETSHGVEPRPIRDAATVVLLRDRAPGNEAPGGIEVFLMRRRPTMDFAPGMYVFPGGAHEAHDGSADELDSLRRTAVRELWEETGVRADADDLVFFDHWVTPEIESRRYDTRFFAVALPPDVEPDATGADRGTPADEAGQASPGEADRAEWVDPAIALTRWRAGELLMLPPTVAAVGAIVEYASVSDALAGLARSAEASPPRPRLPAQVAGTWQILDAYTGDVLLERVELVIP